MSTSDMQRKGGEETQSVSATPELEVGGRTGARRPDVLRRSSWQRQRTEDGIALAGRALVVAASLLATASVTGASAVWLVANALIWLLAIQGAFASYGGELHSLGRSVAAIHGVALGLVGSLAASTLLQAPIDVVSRILLIAVTVFVLLTTWEAVFHRWMAQPRKILIAGLENAGKTIARELHEVRRAPFEVVGYVGESASPAEYCGAAWLGRLEDLPEIIALERPSIVVLALEHDRPAVFGRLLESSEEGFRVVEAPQFCEHAFGRVPVRDITRAWFMSVLHLYQRPYSRFAKRTFDLLGAMLGLIVVSPVLLPVLLLLAISRGPVIFRQTRVGAHGVLFTIYKLRTMTIDAEEPGQPRWAQERDPRVTRLGAIVRRLRLDEVPQLWNVIRGDMSIVGPRPERPEFMAYLEERVPFWSRRHLVKPGITGWAQICRGYTTDAEGSVDKLSYDLWYLRHRSLTVDLAICLQTVPVVIMGYKSKHRNEADGTLEEGGAGSDGSVPIILTASSDSRPAGD